MMDLTWGCKIVGWERKIESFSRLVRQKGFFALNILLHFINKVLVIFKQSAIYFLHFRPVRMKASTDQTCILNAKDIYFQRTSIGNHQTL